MNSDAMRYELSIKFVCLFLIVATIGAIIVLAAVPPVSRDALTHHLFVPKLYLKNGGMYEIPWVEFSYFPMNLDLLYLIPLAFGHDILPKYIHFTFALLTALLIYHQLKKWYGPIFGWMGCLMFLGLPIVIKLSIAVYVDLGLIFFSTLSLISLIAWMENTRCLKHLIISAVGAGLALGTKYNGLVVYLLVALAVPLAYQQSHHPSRGDSSPQDGHSALKLQPFKFFVSFSLIAILLFSPWAIRNAYWTGNPVYPLYDGFFNKIRTDPSSPEDRHKQQIREAFRQKMPLNHFSIRRMVYKESWWEIFLAPIRMFFQGEDDKPRYFDGKLHPFLLFFPFLALLGWRERGHLQAAQRLLMGYSVLYVLIVFLTTDLRIRYIAPAIPPLVILSICGLHDIMTAVQRRFKTRYLSTGIAFLFLGGCFLPAAIYVHRLNELYFPLDYLGKKITRDTYIEHFRPEYAALQFANRNLPLEARILSIFGGNRGYYADRNIFFNNQMLQQLVENSRTSKDISRTLQEMGFTHLMINYEMYQKWVVQYLNARQRERAASFLEDDLRLLFQKGPHLLFVIPAA